MKTSRQILVTANEAVAQIAYKTNEVCTIYPITPASQMSELVEEWSANQHKNIFGSIPSTFEMQSEAGVAGAMHGSLQTGSLSTTFTASQGLLLMLPNMYKIAGELTPNVIHVATRSIATHALSVFGDHSDVMAVRGSGYALLASASVQEAMDFALISQAATLKSRIPFLHFFDGFRTSHETQKIENIPDEVITKMMSNKHISLHRNRALNPNSPVIRGTSQAADTFFQSREAINSFYDECPQIVQNEMDSFAELTGRQYKIIEYIGDSNAEKVIVAMASATETIEETIKHLNTTGEKVGLLKVRLFRPFSKEHLIEALPKTCKAIAVLDKTNEPGSVGEPLFLDVNQAIVLAFNNYDISFLPKIVGGRYGLSSKEFTPSMVKAVYDNLNQDQPENNFTIGIVDDVTNLSLQVKAEIDLQKDNFQALFYETKSKTNASYFKSLVNNIGASDSNYVQAYTECDYKKSNPRHVSNLRLSKQVIKAPYLIENADFIGCESINFLENDNVLTRIKHGGTLVVGTKNDEQLFWSELSMSVQNSIRYKELNLYIFNNKNVEIANTFIKLNPQWTSDCLLVTEVDITPVDYSKYDIVASKEEPSDFANTLLGKLLANKGHDLPVSVFPVDGTYPTDTSKFNKNRLGAELPTWNPEACIQCGACSMACPQGSLRIKVYDDTNLGEAPNEFKYVEVTELGYDFDLLNYTVQVHPEQCTSCNNCVDVCPAKALVMKKPETVLETETETETDNWNYFETIPEFDRAKIDVTKVNQQQLQEPLFKYALGDDGCGEAPYLKLISQLYGDRMMVANATGASSIFGGALPTTPWSKNKEGKGPAWSNSLFEDNAEFGLGYRLSLDQQEIQAKKLLGELANKLTPELIKAILNAPQFTEYEIIEQRKRVSILKEDLKKVKGDKANQLLNIADSLVKKSVWIVGGDGWAYDIGFGGLDHVIASGKNVNILVLDNEVYSNTGGQMSKATPFGASAKFAALGKSKQKKDLGAIAMTYDDVYVASVAMGANQEQTLKSFVEAEQFDGPSIIIAYCHSPAHGIDMRNPSQYHKAAVSSGQWLLYRNDPRRVEKNKNPFLLDSDKPSIPIEDYLLKEKRFSKLFNEEGDNFTLRMLEKQKKVDKKYNKYSSLLNINSGHEFVQ